MSTRPQLQFLGATNTVTGSRFLLDTGSTRLLIDCGLFQGYKYLRERNWQPLPFDPQSLDGVVLTHAHLDHSGYLPVLIRDGFRGPVYCTRGTMDLCGLLLPDSGHLQEEEAAFRNRKGTSKHKPALPLYTRQDALTALESLVAAEYGVPIEVGDTLIEFKPAGHILGSSFIRLSFGARTVVFSGDLGRQQDILMQPPAPLDPCDYLVLESTYGDRRHSRVDLHAQLAEIINTVAQRGGVVLIPSFAVGRAQSIIYLLVDLMQRQLVPKLPLFLDSPMAINASELFCRFPREHRLGGGTCREVFDAVTYIREVEDSIALAQLRYPHIIISASGMATGGRVLHHMKRLLPDERNACVFVGYQAGGTRGARLLDGEREINVHGRPVRVKADIHNVEGLSAHADYEEILQWLSASPGWEPRRCLLVHGEEKAIDAQRRRIEARLGWRTSVPTMSQRFNL